MLAFIARFARHFFWEEKGCILYLTQLQDSSVYDFSNLYIGIGERERANLVVQLLSCVCHFTCNIPQTTLHHFGSLRLANNVQHSAVPVCTQTVACSLGFCTSACAHPHNRMRVYYRQGRLTLAGTRRSMVLRHR